MGGTKLAHRVVFIAVLLILMIGAVPAVSAQEEGRSIAITMATPWWQTWWAYALYVLIALGAVYGFITWRLKSIAAQRRQLEDQVAERTHALGERVKELNCLYSISRLVTTPGISPGEILQGTVDIIPPSWQYPEITSARIQMDEQVFSTENFAESSWRQAADIFIHGDRRGLVEVFYTQEMPTLAEGPFLAEERALLNAIAEQLGKAAEHRSAEGKVHIQNQFLENVLNSLAHPFCVIDAQDRRVLMANDAAHSGPLPADIRCYALTHGSDQLCELAGQHCPLLEVKSRKEPVVMEHIHIDKQGQPRHYEVHGFPILDQSGDVVQMIEYSLDITERKQIEEQQQLLVALEERERIGRELHDDLGQVMGYVSVQAQTALHHLDNRQVDEAHGILNQLTEVAQKAFTDVRKYILGIRIDEYQPSANFFAELDQLLHIQKQHYGLQVQLSRPDEWQKSPFAPEVETQLLRIIQEALTNIRKHAGVTTARLIFTEYTDQVQVSVEDDGRGFDPQTTADAIAIAEPAHGSSGHFGLAIMRERAAAASGHLEVRSIPGQGTRIIITLPRVISQSGQSSAESARGVRVLLVDDHPLYLEGLQNLLVARGMHVVGQAHDGLQAQILARDLRPDLILMDLHMPRCGGLEATRAIKSELPDLKIVILTVAADEKILFEALKSGASGYLLKSLDRAEFFMLLGQVLEGETVLSPTLASRVLSEMAGSESERMPAMAETSLLTARQQEVLQLLTTGKTNKEIAADLHISERTVKYHVGQILERLQLKSRYELGQYARQQKNR